jgi:hypothetical protein
LFRRGKYALLVGAVAGTAAAHAYVPVPPPALLPDGFVAKPEIARAASFGFDAVVADYHWLKAVQIVGGAADPESYGAVLGRLIDVTTTLDPWVGHPYRFAAVWLQGTREDVAAANAILERGIAYHPLDWRNRFYLAFNLFFHFGEEGLAGEVLAPAIEMEGSPRYLGRLVARLRAGTGGLEASAAFLQELVSSAVDPRTRAEYEKALDEIDAERRARFLDAARETYRNRHGVDITAVEDLAIGPRAVMSGLPPEPNGWEWIVDPESGRIVSSFYKKRYEPHIHPAHRIHRDTFGEANATVPAGETQEGAP